MSAQLDLFSSVMDAYLKHDKPVISNRDLYERVANHAGIPVPNERKGNLTPVGKSGEQRNLITRKIRWYQQTLKNMNLIQRIPGKLGLWELTDEGRDKKSELSRANPGVRMVAFSTDLGVALWGNSEEIFARLDAPIALCLTSPPYPIKNPRAYGNPKESEYVDFIVHSIEPIVKHMIPGAVLALNISNDVFMGKSPARSLYRERLVIALCDRLGLFKVDELIWNNQSKAPGPIQWASLKRYQLNTGYEPVYLFTNSPKDLRSNNQRVLKPHSKEHLKLIAQGGDKRHQNYSDGAYTMRPGRFSKETAGTIPKNVLNFGHRCKDQSQYKRDARSLGLPAHGAPFPLALASFLVKFLTDVNDLVVDLFAGSFTAAKAAEINGRPWLAADCMFEYARGSATRFIDCSGFELNPEMDYLLESRFYDTRYANNIH